MKLVLFDRNGKATAGTLDGDTVNVLDTGDRDLSESGLAALIDALPATTGERLALGELRLLAPIPRPRRNIFCVGKNYHDHAHEFANSGFDSSAAKGAVPQHPIIFSKVPESVIGPDEPVTFDPSTTTAVDYEVELTVIIGKAGRNIRRDDALSHVWGYTIINDMTERDLQGQHSQWLIGKSQDTFCPMGPCIVTADELDLADTPVRCRINGELRQDSNTALLIFDVPTIIEALSNGITLLPGDVIATGTPAGVGIGFKPPKYLVPGDVMELEIGSIGTLRNPLAAR